MRYTEEYLFANEKVWKELTAELNTLFEAWQNAGVEEYKLDALLDKYPSTLLIKLYFDRNSCKEEAQFIFVEEIVLPYCIKRRLIKKDKNGKYIDNSKEAEQMPELDFK